MPRVDGYELMRRIRAMQAPERRGVPAIALTAFARGEDAAKARAAGYGVHLPKPVDPSRLFSTIASVLAGATDARYRPGTGRGEEAITSDPSASGGPSALRVAGRR
jgi:CheY-like chemotaxis protein